jgi:hypothetical protein
MEETLEQVVESIRELRWEREESGRRIDQVIERTGQVMERTGQIMERSEQIMERSEQIIERTGQVIERTGQVMERSEQIIERTERALEENALQMGYLNNRFGELAEHLVAPNIKEKFNALGFTFTRSALDVKLSDPLTKRTLTEIDILLENGDIVIAVEVKAKPKETDIEEHKGRMALLRRSADTHNDTRKYRGAIAGAIMPDSVKNYALKAGFYVIEQTGDTVRIDIPEGFMPRDW